MENWNKTIIGNSKQKLGWKSETHFWMEIQTKILNGNLKQDSECILKSNLLVEWTWMFSWKWIQKFDESQYELFDDKKGTLFMACASIQFKDVYQSTHQVPS